MDKRLKSLLWVLCPLLLVVLAAFAVYPPLSGGSGGAAGILLEAGEDKVNINTAPASELAVLPGIGPAKAEAIIAWREENGPFAAIEDLLQVKGIGEATLEGLRDFATI